MPSTFGTLVFAALTAAITPAFGPAQNPGPSFDCARATGQVEQLICKDADLAALDRRMAEVYASALKTWPGDEVTRQRALQRGWISGRNDCWKETDVRACTEYSYRTRIVEIQITARQLGPATTAAYACTGGEANAVDATFRPDTDPPSAMLVVGTDRVMVFQTPTASGVRYIAPDVEFREHQGEATIDFFGTHLTCRSRTGSRPAAGAGGSQPPLGGTSWVLERFQSMDDTTLTPAANTRYALTFGNDGRVTVQADCNRGQGTWQSTDGAALAIGPVALTRAQCPPSPLQERFVRDLGLVRSYVVRDGRLHLSLAADGGIYTFAPERR